MYKHEDELTAIQREADKARAMIEDLQDNYGFEDVGRMTERDLQKIWIEKPRITQKLRIVFDALESINKIVDGIEAGEHEKA